MAFEISCVVDRACKVGEAAWWDHERRVLWWVDILDGLIFSFDPATGENREFSFGEPVGCVVRRQSGGLVVAAQSGIWFFEPETGARSLIANPEANTPKNRFNDGTTDSAGRFWAGTMKEGGADTPAGAFYCLDRHLTIKKWMSGFHTTNGLAFSPDGNRMYFSDSAPSVRKIWVCDYDEKLGEPANPEVFFDTRNVAGRPDGGTVDAEGCYWQAGVDGWCLYRISPEGELMATIEMPIEKPSKPMFGGPDLDVLFVTSIGINLSQYRTQSNAGGLFSVSGLGVKGVPQRPFAG